jgi:hypothetical protein
MKGAAMNRVAGVALSPMFFVAFCCCGSLAAADPIRLTSGELIARGLFEPADRADLRKLNGHNLGIEGAGFSIGSSLEDEVAYLLVAPITSFETGAVVDFSGVFLSEDPLFARLNDIFGLVAAPVVMSFHSSPATLTCSREGSFTRCTGTAPFTFDARLTLHPPDGTSITHDLTGSGTVVGAMDHGGTFDFGNLIYTFEASPTPEPATLSLLTTGAMMAGARAYRRRHDRTPGDRTRSPETKPGGESGTIPPCSR